MPLSPESSVESTNEEEVNSSDESDESSCVICGGEDGSKRNAIVFCDGEGCDIPVHQRCYGIDVVPPGNQKWFCQRCADKIPVDQTVSASKIPICCDKTEGAFKRTDIPGSYIHVLCAKWNPAIDKSKEPWCVSSLLQESQICYLCEKSSGICTQCSYSKAMENGSIRKCKRWFHVTCAVDAEILALNGNQGSSKLGLMCREHKEEHQKNRRNNLRKRGSISVVTPTKKRKVTNQKEKEKDESDSESEEDEEDVEGDGWQDQQNANGNVSRVSEDESEKSDAELGTNGNSDVDEAKERARRPFRNTLQEILNGKRSTTSSLPSSSQSVNGHKHRQPKTTPKGITKNAKSNNSEEASDKQASPSTQASPRVSPKIPSHEASPENQKSKSPPTNASTRHQSHDSNGTVVKKELSEPAQMKSPNQEELELMSFCEMYLADQQPRLATLESIIHRMKYGPTPSHKEESISITKKEPSPLHSRFSRSAPSRANTSTQTQPLESTDSKQPSQTELLKQIEELQQKLQDSDNTFSRFKSIQTSETHRLRSDCEHLSKENHVIKQQLQDIRNDYLKLMNSSRNLRSNLVAIFEYLKLPHQKGPVDLQTIDDRVRELGDIIRRTNIDERKRRDVISKVLKDVDNAK